MTRISIDLPFANFKGDLRSTHLFDLIVEAHQVLATNHNCCSTAAYINSYKATKSQPMAIASAILTLNNLHAPIEAARGVFDYYDDDKIRSDVAEGKRIAGFGNAFVKDSIDPVWLSVQGYMMTEYWEEYKRMIDLQNCINGYRQAKNPKAKEIFCNPALFTAVLCSIYNVDYGNELTLFVMARLPIWTNIGTQMD